jgi:hypothetical protein
LSESILQTGVGLRLETARPFPKIAAVISGGAAEANNRIR